MSALLTVLSWTDRSLRRQRSFPSGRRSRSQSLATCMRFTCVDRLAGQVSRFSHVAGNAERALLKWRVGLCLVSHALPLWRYRLIPGCAAPAYATDPHRTPGGLCGARTVLWIGHSATSWLADEMPAKSA